MMNPFLLAISLIFVATSAFAAEPIRLAAGETHNFATWAFTGVDKNEVRLSVGVGTVEVKQYDRQLLVTYRAPEETLTSIEQLFIVVKDRMGQTHARHLATIALGKPKTADFRVASICVGQTSVLPIIAGDAQRPFLIQPLSAIHAERPANLQVELLGTEGDSAGFAKVTPLAEGTHAVILVSKNNVMRQGQVFGVDCSAAE